MELHKMQVGDHCECSVHTLLCTQIRIKCERQRFMCSILAASTFGHTSRFAHFYNVSSTVIYAA